MKPTNKNIQKESSFQWTAKREEAALLTAQDELTVEEVAKRLGMSRPCLCAWRKTTEFMHRVDEERLRITAAIRKHGIAVPEMRVRALQDRWRRMMRVIEERGADPLMANVPGGSTGMLVRWVKTITTNDGKSEIMEEEYRFDAALCAELRAHEKQAAQELKQWSERHEHSGENGMPIPVQVDVKFDFTGFSTDELIRIRGAFRPAQDVGGGRGVGETGRN
jgi:hypothetical protein